MWFEILVICLVISYIVYNSKRSQLYKFAEQFEGPTPLPLIGNALHCMMPVTEMCDAILKNSYHYKSPSRFWFGPQLYLYVTDPEDIKTVLNNSHALTKLPYLYTLSEAVLGRGLITLPVPKWKRNRRLILPNFNQQNLKNSFSTFNSHSSELVSNLKDKAGKGDFDVGVDVVNCTLQLVLKCLMGYESYDKNSIDTKDVLDSLKGVFAGIIARMSNIMYMSEFIFNKTPSGKKFKEAKEKYAMVLNSIVDKWKNDLVIQYKNGEDDRCSDLIEKPVTFMEHLLQTCDEVGKLTDDELREEANTFIFAGLESTASITSFLAIMLGMHPEIQEKVYEEIQSVLGADQQLRYEDLPKFEYLDRTIKETLRVFPVLAGLGRYSDQNIKLKEHVIPANTNIVVALLSLHRDPKIWPNPNKFDPDRFLPEECAKRHPYSWIPFSAGPRNCIGLNFGMVLIKLITIDIVKKFRIGTTYKSVEEIPLSMLLIIKPTDGYRISINNR